jgi:hypothetical protein
LICQVLIKKREEISGAQSFWNVTMLIIWMLMHDWTVRLRRWFCFNEVKDGTICWIYKLPLRMMRVLVSRFVRYFKDEL